MLTIAVGANAGEHLADQLMDKLREDGIEVLQLGDSEWPSMVGIDTLVTTPVELDATCAHLARAGRSPRVVVVIGRATASSTRALLARGAHAIVNESDNDTLAQQYAILAAAAGYCVIPGGHGIDLATRLEAPPHELEQRDRQLLALAAGMSITEAGRQLGLSRRQAQRRFGAACDRLGIPNRWAAVAAAARWGLTNSEVPSPVQA